MNLAETDVESMIYNKQRFIKCITNPCTTSFIINQITVNQCWFLFMIHVSEFRHSAPIYYCSFIVGRCSFYVLVFLVFMLFSASNVFGWYFNVLCVCLMSYCLNTFFIQLNMDFVLEVHSASISISLLIVKCKINVKICHA